MSSNNVDTKNNNITKRKKNPRDMTIEELEEYIKKNKNKINELDKDEIAMTKIN